MEIIPLFFWVRLISFSISAILSKIPIFVCDYFLSFFEIIYLCKFVCMYVRECVFFLVSR
jgi:hypothetical protein